MPSEIGTHLVTARFGNNEARTLAGYEKTGGYEVLDAFEKKLGLAKGMSNQQFTLVEEECIAACANAPCALVGTRYLLDITPAQVPALVEELRKLPHPEGEVV